MLFFSEKSWPYPFMMADSIFGSHLCSRMKLETYPTNGDISKLLTAVYDHVSTNYTL